MQHFVRLSEFKVLKQMEETTETPKGVTLIQAPEIWNQTKGEGVTIAILDTGCDPTHPELKDRIIGGRNFTEDDEGNPEAFNDYNGHGTHVAGTIAAEQNEQGVVGVAPKADLLIIKVLDKDGSGNYQWIIDGIQYAINQGVDIISMSIGGPTEVPALHTVIKKAVTEHNIPVVCAAGNEGDGKEETVERAYPGSYNEVISVGAVNLDRRSSDFSNTNREVDIVAPGEEITSTYLNGTYATLSGTSMATPHIAGALALIKNITTTSFERELTEAELYAQLIRRTLPLGYSAKFEGNGLVYLTLLDYLDSIFDNLKTKSFAIMND
ncbi:S8 family peptidase [Paraliobacillus zengyii]|uniref:S8 family peptidase n=1 Tax=Paraliobacillus zengyii TaxID=2213194 RepID=UPI000DD4ECCD|nr:S8 family peptidase [Paraliobacillus zengyii]